MRERTPSADDTPKRAPPAPPREAASADVVGGGRGARIELWTNSHFLSPTAVQPTPTNSLDNLIIVKQEHQDNYNNQQQRPQQKQQQVTTPPKTAQDKRSRLSNVINNLRKKVPDTVLSSRDNIEEKNSVERNLETLEKYVMTVLNGVIKDAENNDEQQRKKNDLVHFNGTSSKDNIGIDIDKKPVNREPSEPSEVEPAVPTDTDKNDCINKCSSVNKELSPSMLLQNKDETKTTKDFNITSRIIDSRNNEEITEIEDPKKSNDDKDDTEISNDAVVVATTMQNELSSIENSTENKIGALGTIILDRLNDNDSGELIKASSNNVTTDDIRTICKILIDDILNEVQQQTAEKSNIDIVKLPTTSLHCSLPLEKVGSILQVTESSDKLNLTLTQVKSHDTTISSSSSSLSPSSSSSSSSVNKSNLKSPNSPIVRHLCLYCDRKFLSISLCQRHTERVHQQGGGRRSERNSRKSNLNCQYCTEKSTDNLDTLFQHMINNHSDKYHACIQCTTRYSTKDGLQQHTSEVHGIKEFKDIKPTTTAINETNSCSEHLGADNKIEGENKKCLVDVKKISTPIKLNTLSRLSSPIDINSDFDFSFYSSVSCNIRDNLLHHLDGKLQNNEICSPILSSSLDIKQQSQQSFYDSSSQIQLPTDISSTAATPVDSKEPSNNDNSNNSSEYAEKPDKVNQTHRRRVSFEKYNFPKKYDGKEPWDCTLKDLSKFDINTQLILRKKQDKLKCENLNEVPFVNLKIENDKSIDNKGTENIIDDDDDSKFTSEFSNFMRLRRWDECKNEKIENKEIIYAELSGEWSRPRVYICSACSSRHLTLKEIEDHKLLSHPNVWCLHLEFSGDQIEVYKNIFLPGQDLPIKVTNNLIIPDKICTKCLKTCSTLAELHRHMLECGGDQTWLLGLFGNGKKKCKWRPFGSRRRRQRGMKRNIQNSQTSRTNNEPKERQSTGPRVRPSDQETIRKMIANLPPKRLTRRVAEQEATSRSQARLRKIHAKSRPDTVDNTSSNITLSRKTVLRNKLLKNAKSFQRKRCRGDNISAAIESVINNYDTIETKDINNTIKLNNDKIINSTISINKKSNTKLKNNNKIVNEVRVLSKRKNVKLNTRRVNSTTVKINDHNSKKVKKSNKEKLKNILTQSKTRSNILMVEESEEVVEKQQQIVKRKKSIDSLTSLTASLKAKSQLRSQDGKFLKNPELDKKISSSSSSSQADKSLRRSQGRINAASEEITLSTTRRFTRLSCDSDKMPILEAVEQKSSKNHDNTLSEKVTNNFPILTPAMTTSNQSSSTTPDTKTLPASILPKIIKDLRGKRKKTIITRRLKNIRKNTNSKIDNSLVSKTDNNLEEPKESRTRNKKLQLKTSSTSVEECPTSTEKIDVIKKSNATTKLELSSKKNNIKVFKTRQSKELTKFDDVKNKIKKKFVNRKLLRSNNSTQIVGGLPARTRRNLRKNIDKKLEDKKLIADNVDGINVQSKDIKNATTVEVNDKNVTTRKSPRSTIENNKKEISDVSTDKIQIEETVNELVETENVKNIIKSEEESVKNVECKNLESEIKEKVIENKEDEEEKEEEDEEEGEEEEEEDLTIDDKNNKKEILTADLVSLNFEHLQQESSNSNIDSGKENSSETPINISKPKANRPKKSRGFRRDRIVKRGLNNVIGILTEGVNIPVDIQQSVVLTVQTTIENQINTNTLQNNRVELADTNNSTTTTIDSSNSITNDNQNPNVEVGVSIDDGNSENASQELQRIKHSMLAEENKDKKLENKIEISPTESSSVSSTSVVVTPVISEQPTNDIILDLSRRKQKGKGSFLEKIVSKIAKQKDAMLEGEVGSLLDNAVDELSIILDDVVPSIAEQNDIDKKDFKVDDDKKSANTDNDCEKINKIVDDSTIVVDNLMPIINNSTIIVDNLSEKHKVCENTLSNDESNKVLPVNNENTIKDLATISCTKTILNTTEMKNEVRAFVNSEDTDERTSKKRSLDVLTSTKNKRKSIQDNREGGKEKEEGEKEAKEKGKEDNDKGKEENNDEASEIKRKEEDVCLADIMKLINRPRLDIRSNTLQEKNRSSKRKNCDKDQIDNNCVNNNDNAGDVKKPGVNLKKKIRTEGTRRSTRRSNPENFDKIETLTKETDNSLDIGQTSKSINSDNAQVAKDHHPVLESKEKISKNSEEIIINERLSESLASKSTVKLSEIDTIKVPEIKATCVDSVIEKKEKSKQRNSKKKTIVNEHLLLPEDNNTTDGDKINKLTRKNKENSTAKNEENLPVKIPDNLTVKNKELNLTESVKCSVENTIDTLAVNDLLDNQENSVEEEATESKEPFKVPEITDVLSPQLALKRGSKKKSLTNDTSLDSTEPPITSKLEQSTNEANEKSIDINSPQKSRRSSKRKNNDNNSEVNDEIIEKSKTTVVVERRQTLKRKAKENIFLIEELLDFGDDMDSPSPLSNTTADENVKTNSIENVTLTEKNELPVSSESQLENKEEKKQEITVALNENLNKTEITTTIDDTSTPKKRTTGNFAVVHTKTGEISIVEKKKKLTKEAAKFFCNICTTSFTRKSSLKKHNQSQSHLLQVKKSSKEIVGDNKEESMSLDDTTASSIDNSEATQNLNHNEISLNDNNITQSIMKITDNEKDKIIEKENIELKLQVDVVAEIKTIDKKIINVNFDSQQLNDDLEDELLDEEICKITENMSHDEYVLTDHISPEDTSTPVKDDTDRLIQVNNIDLKNNQHKFSLADEHLDLDSPIIIPKNIKLSPILLKPSESNDLKILDKLNTSDDILKLNNTNNVCLDFTNITEKLKSNEIIKNNNGKDMIEMEFDSDENSSSINISNKISKLIDDSEMNIDNNKLSPIETIKISNDNLFSTNIKSVDKIESLSLKKSKKSKNKIKKIDNEKDGLSGTTKKSIKLSDKSREVKLKNHSKQSKKKSTSNPNDSEKDDDDDDDDENITESQNKNKIVKSVFGRVFCGEKVDKVKEVLDDWVSRSESESLDENLSTSYPNLSSNWKDEKLHKRDTLKQEKSNNQSKTKLQTEKTTPETDEIFSSSRCRQSKKRAEERISRAFEEESVLYDLAFESKNAGKSLKNIKINQVSEKLDNQDDKKMKNKDKKHVENNLSNDTDEKLNESNNDSNKSTKNKISCSDEILSADSMESIHTPIPSCPRERSSTPDIISQTTRDSENDADEVTDMDNDDDDDDDDDENDNILHGRLSPLYTSNLPETSIDSGSNTSNNNKNNSSKIETTKIRSSGEFSGEKIVIRSPVSSHENSRGVVTIAPTDAIEDNALDVPQEIEANKSRQGKVLNFDEELFVECCSRLKATTENELRGAKKINIDHNDSYQSTGMKQIRDRWRDVESQNSLGSLLDSVNQLLGEEMYNNSRMSEHPRRGRNQRSERPNSPTMIVHTDFIRPDNLGYEDSLDVAFEHNNKLRDKIQQRMRESENLIATSFSQKVSSSSSSSSSHNGDNDEHRHRHHHHHHHHHHHRHHDKKSPKSDKNLDNLENLKDADNNLHDDAIKNKVNSNIDGFLDKALSNLLQNNGKHDHNGSTPMNVLAELACAQVPTSTTTDVKNSTCHEKLSMKILPHDKEILSSSQVDQKIDKELPRKNHRNTIKELFVKKNEINERKNIEEKLSTILKPQKNKKLKRQQQNEFPLIRKSQFGGMPERKRRLGDNNSEKRKRNDLNNQTKDVYDFDDEESQTETGLKATSYRNKNEKSIENNDEILMDDLMTRAIKKTLDNGRNSDAIGKRLESMIERKFKEFESFAPKTKGALKAFHVEETKKSDKESITGPMDTYIERKQIKKRLTETTSKQLKKKKSTKNLKKRGKTLWYENDSSDEFKTVIKTDDIGVGISKSQRTCSKGKQNLFAELSTSSDSEYNEDDDDDDDEKLNKTIDKLATFNENKNSKSPELADNYPSEHEDCKIEDWMDISSKTESKNNIDHKKSESDMSDIPLVIDERKDDDDDDDNDFDDNGEQRNSDEETDNRSERAFELDDLYREDSSVVDSDCDDNNSAPQINNKNTNENEIFEKNELIPLDEALNILDGPENSQKSPGTVKLSSNSKSDEENSSEILTHKNTVIKAIVDDTINLPEKLSSNKKPEKISENLPLHVFLSRKVQESKKRKEEELKKIKKSDDNNVVHDYQPTRRQRKCAIGKQGLLAEISSSDEEYYVKENNAKRTNDKFDYDKIKKQKKSESKEKRKERYLEKKHEQIIAKEQKAIEEEIHRQREMKNEKLINDSNDTDNDNNSNDEKLNKKHQRAKKLVNNSKNKEKLKKESTIEKQFNSDSENNCNTEEKKSSPVKKKTERDCQKNKKKEIPTINSKNSKTSTSKNSTSSSKNNVKTQNKNKTNDRSRVSLNKETKERKLSSTKRESDDDDDDLRTTKRWNNVDDDVGVAIGRRKRAAANQLYYWSSSSDDDEELIQPSSIVEEEEEEDDRQEQHGWIVGDSHKRMITMLAMEKQLKEKRRRSGGEDYDSGKSKNKKHRNSMS